MQIHARWTLSPDDLLDAQFATPQTRAANWNAAFIWCIAIAGVAYVTGIWWWLAILLGLAGGAAAPYVRRYPMRSIYVRNLAGKRSDELEMDYEFRPTGYRAKGMGAISEIDWSALHGWVEGPKTISFLTSEVGMEVVPKRALAETELQALRDLLRERVRPREIKHRRDPWSTLLTILFVAFLALVAWSSYSGHRH